MSFRSAVGVRVEWRDMRPPHGSNFAFIGEKYGSHPILRRIFSLARKLDYQSVLVERIEQGACPLFQAEDDALRRRQSDFQGSTVDRFSFFRCPPESDDWRTKFLGYAVFKQDCFRNPPRTKPYVYEAVLPPPREAVDNNFLHTRRAYKVCVAGEWLEVHGALYAQQNNLTFVCAHVALRSALSAVLPEGDITYEQINSILKIDHQSVQLGSSRGLSPDEISTVLDTLRVPYQKLIHEPQQAPLQAGYEYQRDLYGCIESRGAALVGFELGASAGCSPGRHVIPVIGHTFNEDAWVPEADRHYFGGTRSYFASESWLSSYLIHDDNFGPYQCLPRHYLGRGNFRILFCLNRNASPSTAVEVEATAFSFLQHLVRLVPQLHLPWYNRFAAFGRNDLLILRTLQLSREEYVAHLSDLSDVTGARLDPLDLDHLQQRLPERLWMVEVSAQELFTVSRRKFGEVLLDATSVNSNSHPVFTAVRLPGMIQVASSGGFDVKAARIEGHTDLFSFRSS